MERFEKTLKDYKIKIITPVHIGAGNKLSQMDYVQDNGKLWVIDIEKVIHLLQDNQKALQEFGQAKFDMKKFLDKISYPEVAKYFYSSPEPDFRKEIGEFIKTGLGSPYIPGSSIKGALRTVILWQMMQQANEKETTDIKNILNDILNDPRVEKEQADGELDHYLFGPDPNHDFLRGLQVGDATFDLSNLRLIETKVLSVDGRGGYGWKKMGGDGFNTPQVDKATPIHCEALYPEANAEFRIKVEDFLFDNSITKKALGFSDRKGLLMGIAKICNEFAHKFISDEIAFFTDCQMKKMVQFYSNLRIEVPNDEKSFLLHLGWGSGWRGMTGDWLSDRTLRRFREKFRKGMGKSIKNQQTDKWEQFPIFPKTRKIVFEDGVPKYPLGWVKIAIKEEK